MSDTFTLQEVAQITQMVVRFAEGDPFCDIGSLQPRKGQKNGLGHFLAFMAAERDDVATLKFCALQGVDFSVYVMGRGVHGSIIGNAVVHGSIEAVDFLRQQPGIDISQEGLAAPRSGGPLWHRDITLIESALHFGHPKLAEKLAIWAAEQRDAKPIRSDANSVARVLEPSP